VPGGRPALSAELPRGSGALVRRAVDANLRYYEAVGEITLDYLRALRALAGEAGGTRWIPAPAPAPAPAPPPSAPPPAAPPPTLVLEAEPGETAIGAFLVQNLLAERVSAPVSVGAFTTPDGREVAVRLTLDPEVVTLEPGEQMLVRAAATIGEELEPGVSHRGEISVPGLTGTRVPLVVRRRDSAAG
jgi:hypothetical protein